MDIQDSIRKLIEERKVEAIKKDLSKKIRTIVKVLGFDVKFDHLEDNNEDTHYVSFNLDLHDHSHGDDVIAKYFDATTSGINLQIKYEANRELLKVMFNGVQVYLEQNGQLESYIPSSTWENHIESFVKLAVKRSKIMEKEEKDDKIERKKNALQQIAEYLQKTWGYGMDS